jgi:hypothetical protein
MKAETKTEVKVGLKAEAQGQEKVEKEAGEKVCPR